jgi:hypothetical protein
MGLLLLPLGFAAPWLAGIAWVRLMGGPGTLVPHDEVPPSAGEAARQRLEAR